MIGVYGVYGVYGMNDINEFTSTKMDELESEIYDVLVGCGINSVASETLTLIIMLKVSRKYQELLEILREDLG